MRLADTDWNALARDHGGKKVIRLRQILDEKEHRIIDAAFVLERFQAKFEEYRPLLDALVAMHALERQEISSCPYCQARLKENDVPQDGCESDGVDCAYEQNPTDPKIDVRYIHKLPDSRDLRWAILIHGMNTHGLWQQDFSWHVMKMFGYSIPVDIYKYGRISISPFFFWRQLYVKSLRKRIESRIVEMQNLGVRGRPDVIAHSFGTWLFMKVLMQNDGRLKFGRVILTGCIIPPDFDWTPYLEGTLSERRIDAVMCHYGKRDFVVSVARFFIPHAGPSGRIGFSRKPAGLFLKGENDFGHSSYFAPERLQSVIEDVWKPFIEIGSRDDKLSFDQDPSEKSVRWIGRRFWFIAGFIPKWAMLLALSGSAVLSIRNLPILSVLQMLLAALAVVIVFLGVPLVISQFWKFLDGFRR